jgi:hypothetical protein
MYRTATTMTAASRRLATLLALLGLAFGFTAVTVVSAQRPAQALCVASAFQGSWKNIDPTTRAMVRVDVSFTCNDVVLCDQNGNCTGGGSGHTMKAWGACSPSPCYWGSRTATSMTDGWLRAVYNFGFKTSTVWLKTYVYYGRTYLRVYVNNDFTVADGRTDYVTDEWMLK